MSTRFIIISILLLLILSLTTIISPSIISEPKSISSRSKETYYRSEDWVIESGNIFTKSDEKIVLSGNLTIKRGGSLILNNITLCINCSYDGEYQIEVKSGGELFINNSKIVDSDFDEDNDAFGYDNPNDFEYNIIVEKESKFEIRNSEITECGFHKKGFRIQTNDTTLELNKFYNISGIYYENSNNHILNNNDFLNIPYGLYFHFSDNNTIKNNSIYVDLNILLDNYFFSGIYIFHSNNFLIMNNSISSEVYSCICLEVTNNIIIKRNRINNSFINGIWCKGVNEIIIKSNFINNTGYRGIEVESNNKNISIEGNIIINNKFEGILLEYCENISILNNYIYNNSEWGIKSVGYKPFLFNNTFIGENGSTNGLGIFNQRWDFSIHVYDLDNNIIKENIIDIYDSFNNLLEKDYYSYYVGEGLSNRFSEYNLLNNGTKISFSPYTVYVELYGINNTTTIIFNNNIHINITLNLSDFDDDGIYNIIDDDDDNDGVNDTLEEMLNYNSKDPNSKPPDLDEDGIPDSIDNDIDGDNVLNEDDDYPEDPDKWKEEKSSKKKVQSDFTNIWLIFGVSITLIIIIVTIMIVIYYKQQNP